MNAETELRANALAEWAELQESIRSHDKLRSTIQGWAITLGLALTGFGIESNSANLAAIGVFSSIAFWLLDSQKRMTQRLLVVRSLVVEEVLHQGTTASAPGHPGFPGIAHHFARIPRSREERGRTFWKEAMRPTTWSLYAALVLLMGVATAFLALDVSIF